MGSCKPVLGLVLVSALTIRSKRSFHSKMHNISLNMIHCSIGNQWTSLNFGVTWSPFEISFMSSVAAFGTSWTIPRRTKLTPWAIDIKCYTGKLIFLVIKTMQFVISKFDRYAAVSMATTLATNLNNVSTLENLYCYCNSTRKRKKY